VVAALAVGAVVGAGLAVIADGGGSEPVAVVPPGPDDPDETAAAAAGFLEAWERSRTATYRSVSTFTRTTADGTTVSATSTLVQRPPDRLVAQGGAVAGWLDGERRRCDPTPDGVRCQTVDAEGGWAAEVAADLAVLTGYVTGPRPLYRVAVDAEGCFRLRLARAVLAPPYGTRARWCFDPATGAVTRLEVVRREATDVVVATEIDPEVTDADLAALATPPGAGAGPGGG
jgi:hypothetical protein